jgi:hypothetical protein
MTLLSKTVVVIAVALTAAGAANAGPPIPNGVYRATITRADLHVVGVSAEDQATNAGTWTLTISNGSWKIANRPPPNYPPGDHIAGTYTIAGTFVTFLHKTPKLYAGVAPKMTWSFDGTALHLKPVSGFPAKAVAIVWTKHAWKKIR